MGYSPGLPCSSWWPRGSRSLGRIRRRAGRIRLGGWWLGAIHWLRERPADRAMQQIMRDPLDPHIRRRCALAYLVHCRFSHAHTLLFDQKAHLGILGHIIEQFIDYPDRGLPRHAAALLFLRPSTVSPPINGLHRPDAHFVQAHSHRIERCLIHVWSERFIVEVGLAGEARETREA